jgi:hypothetical protein
VTFELSTAEGRAALLDHLFRRINSASGPYQMVGALGDGIVLRCDIDGYQGGKGNLTNGKGGGNGGDDQGGKGGGNGGGKGKGGSGAQQATSRLQAIYLPEVPVGRFNSQVRVNGSECNNGSRSIQLY